MIRRGKTLTGGYSAPLSAFGDEKPKPEYKLGDCYENAITAMIHEVAPHERNDYRVVHGIVTGQGKIGGVRYGHAWIEFRLKFNGQPTGIIMAYDPANNVTIPAEQYRRLGQATNIKSYTFEGMRQEMERTGHCGPWDEDIAKAAHTGKPTKKKRRKNPMSDDEELRLRQDHGVSANYLKNKRESARNAGFYRTPKGTLVPKDFGPDTASFNRDVLFPVSLLADVPGLTGEETFEREESMRYLLPFMETYNHLPTYKTFRGEELQTSPFIQVWINGKWYVNEGNHRIKVARRLGWKYIPLQIRWFSGADLESHPEGFTPEQVIAFDTLAHNEGYSVSNFRGKIGTL